MQMEVQITGGGDRGGGVFFFFLGLFTWPMKSHPIGGSGGRPAMW